MPHRAFVMPCCLVLLITSPMSTASARTPPDRNVLEPNVSVATTAAAFTAPTRAETDMLARAPLTPGYWDPDDVLSEASPFHADSNAPPVIAGFENTLSGSSLRRGGLESSHDRHWRHDDRVPPTLPLDVQKTRRACAFEAQCWSVAAPAALVGGGALVMTSRMRHQGTFGATLIATGLIGGSAFGWARAGYWDRALLSMAVRTGTAACALGLGLAMGVAPNGGNDTAGGVAVVLGVSAIGVETVMDVRHIGRHVRAHGFAHDARVSLLTMYGPGLAVSVPLP